MGGDNIRYSKKNPPPPQGGGVIWNRTQTLALGETGRHCYEIKSYYFLIIIIVETPGAWPPLRFAGETLVYVIYERLA